MTGSGLPVSAGQESMWFLHRLAPESAAYNVVLGVRVHSPLDPDRLRSATAALARRHELLHSLHLEEDGVPLRRLAPSLAVPFEVREVPGVTDEELTVLAREAGARPFRLREEWPLRVVLLRRGPADAALVVAAHHIASDATSQWLMLRDLLDAYAGGYGGTELPAAPVLYSEHVAEERRLAATPARERAERYWAGLGEGTTAATLVADRPRTGAAALRGATYEHRVAPELAARLPGAAARAKVTPFGLLLGAFQAAVHRSTGLDDFVIGCPASVRIGRGRADMVGYLVQSLALRARFAPDTTIGDTVGAAHRGLLRGMSHLRHPVPVPQFAMTVTLLAVDRLPVPGLVGTEQGADYAGLRLTLLDLPHMEGQFDFNVELRSSPDSLTVVLRYADDLFDLQTVRRFAEVHVRMIEAALDEPGAAVSRIPLVSTGELADLLSFGAGHDDW
ncbi:peptide synthetase [Streptomyces sp. ISL-96]|uniref:condensation domain-containing protein n=1 Tax=Streptomyces sp. ISL-96 TaxID=2819191 RepID=UPI001BEB0FE9|nr:condensation domain-containing protein [Streptomyces sp. ISL-96]MBT2491909.1 peptide synthetase [Streptomyces sp. ISL-96]